jgi:hypothetical protein
MLVQNFIQINSPHVPTWELIQQRSSVARRWSVTNSIPIYAPLGTPERGNDEIHNT